MNAPATTVACSAAPGSGGLGRHLGHLLESLDGRVTRYWTTHVPPGAPEGGVTVRMRGAALLRLPPARFDARVRTHVQSVLFDRAVRRAFVPAVVHVGFAGQSLLTFRAAAAAGTDLVLVSPTAHVALARRRYAEAFAHHPLEQPWLGRGLAARTEAEYELADTIQVASEYVRESFLEAGFDAARLERVHLTVPRRFAEEPYERPHDGVFRVLYCGGLTVAKGVPVLLDAFARLPLPDAELTLVGGWSSRGMRRHVRAAAARDPRIRLETGDPLRHLRRADVYVHPSFQDGFGYAPLEALACGVPVIVTEDTGMKEQVREGETGHIVPTGDLDALVDRLLLHHSAPLSLSSDAVRG